MRAHDVLHVETEDVARHLVEYDVHRYFEVAALMRVRVHYHDALVTAGDELTELADEEQEDRDGTQDRDWRESATQVPVAPENVGSDRSLGMRRNTSSFIAIAIIMTRPIAEVSY